MSIQLEVVKFRDLVPILSIPRFVSELDAPAIEIQGEDFSNVESVVINSTPSPEFIIVTKQKIFAQLPEGTTRISTIEVLSSDFTRTRDSSKLLFKLGDKTHTIEGLLKLIQLFTKWLLQSPGSDIFNPERGGGLQELVGSIVSTKRMEPVMASVIRSVQSTTTQIRSAQSGISAPPLSEKLLSAEVVDMNVYEKDMEARVRISVQSIAGPVAVSEIGL